MKWQARTKEVGREFWEWKGQIEQENVGDMVLGYTVKQLEGDRPKLMLIDPSWSKWYSKLVVEYRFHGAQAHIDDPS